MTPTRSPFLFLSCLSFFTLSACGAGSAGKAVRPDDPTASSALSESGAGGSGGGGGGSGGVACSVAPAHAEPLVVDWKTNDQLELTVAMQKGVALVAYDCKTIRVIKGCSVEGKYAFTAIPSVLQEAVQIGDADELKASLPFSGGSLGGEVSRGSSIDIALAYVGKRSAINDVVLTTTLVGPECSQATHFVRGASVGAFTMATGTKGETKAAAQIFGMGASGASSSGKKKLNSAGEVGSCKGGSGAANPPDGCAAILRLELVALSGGAGAGGAGHGGIDEGSNPPPLSNTCPDGFVPANGRCAKKTSTAAGGRRCDPKDREDCKEQCSKGNAESCYNAALSLIVGAEIGGPRQQEAMPLFDKACKAAVGRACFWMGSIYANDPKIPDGTVMAGEFAKKSCDLLVPEGCALEAAREQGIDAAKRTALRKRSCDLGYNTGCVSYADDLLAGRDGVPRNAVEGAKILAATCDASDKAACERLIAVYKNHAELKDPAKSDAVKARACQRGVKLYSCPK